MDLQVSINLIGERKRWFKANWNNSKSKDYNKNKECLSGFYFNSFQSYQSNWISLIQFSPKLTQFESKYF